MLILEHVKGRGIQSANSTRTRKGVNHIWSVISIRMTLREIRIYLIIGFMFAQGKWRRRSLILEALALRGLSGQILSQAQDSKRRRKVEGSCARWFIINASRRPPDIIFTLCLSAYCRRSKNTWAQTSESFRKGDAEDKTESKAGHDTVATHTHSHTHTSCPMSCS